MDELLSGMGEWLRFFSQHPAWWFYLLLFAAAVTENLFPPFPGDSVFFFAIVLAATGDYSVIGVFLATSAGGFAGLYVLYWFGRWKGRPFFAEGPKRWWRSPDGLKRTEDWFAHWGGWIVVFGRFMPVIRSLVAIVAGIANMPHIRLAILGAISVLLWNGTLATAGYYFGKNWETVSRMLRTYQGVLLIALAAIFAIWLAIKIRRVRKAGL